MSTDEPTVGRRFVAGWREGDLIPAARLAADLEESPRAPARREPPPSAWQFAEPTEDPHLYDTLRAARAQGLPTLFRADGMRFATAFPLLMEHVDPQAGHVTHVTRLDDNTFEASGWIDAEHADAAESWGFVSPGIQNRSAAIVDDILYVVESEVVELSVCRLPIREGTYFRLTSDTQRIPDAQRFAVARNQTFRMLSDDGEERYLARERERVALQRPGA